jgi:hypothetical protein
MLAQVKSFVRSARDTIERPLGSVGLKVVY